MMRNSDREYGKLKTYKAVCLLTNAPLSAVKAQLDELNIKVRSLAVDA